MKNQIIQEIPNMPEPILREVYGLMFPKKGTPQKEEVLIPISESSWGTDWSRSED